MKKAGRSKSYIFWVWTVIADASTVAAIVGYAVVGGFLDAVIAAVTAVAAGRCPEQIRGIVPPAPIRQWRSQSV